MRLLLALFLLVATPHAAAPRAQGGPDVLVHYMPWFQAKPYGPAWGWHWTMNRFNPDVVGADGEREIASHYHPLIGPYDSRDPDVLEYHALLMKVAGVSGVAVDWYGTSSLYDYPLLDAATSRLFDEVGQTGLRFAVVYEDASLRALVDAGRIRADQTVQQARTDMAAVRDRWAGDARYYTRGGQPVVLNFGPQVLRTSAEWTSVLSVFPTPPLFVTEDQRLAPVGAGAFPWPPMWASVNGTLTPARLAQYLDEFYGRAASWPLAVGGAFTGFHDIYQQAGVRASYGYLDDRGGQTLAETLRRAVASGAPVVQVATWNDFGEGTMVEPTRERGYRDLETVQAAVRAWRTLPYAAADLALPVRLYTLRKQPGTNPATTARLDDAAARLASGDPAGARAILDALAPTTGTEALAEGLAVSLSPNPARGAVTLALTLPDASDVRVDVLDATGRLVVRLADGRHGAGEHQLRWETLGSPGGLYLVRVRVGDAVLTRRVALVGR